MCVQNPLNFGKDNIIFRTHTFWYHKSLCVMIHVSLKGHILLVNIGDSGEFTISETRKWIDKNILPTTD